MSIKKITKNEFKDTFLSPLLNINDCPKQINFVGTLFPKNKYKFVAIVGSRQHSNYAKEALQKIIEDLSGYNIVIISGLALGIDALAHKYAMENNLKTIAIPGSGLDENIIYPKSNLNLAKNILDHKGLLLSEFDNDFKATPWSFPQRNRIMAGLADVVLVVEAKEKSGTLITARLALDYNKDLAVIPNSIFSKYSDGSNALLKQGACPVFSGNDILELLGENNKIIKQEKLDLDNFSKREQQILNILDEPKNKQEIQKQLNINITTLNTELSILELKGVIKESLGKFRKIL